ncbi:cytochrome d ubiquinol oxidase subunit II [Herbiconiux sp. L3-i23]|uniref:cytochrome d ubiquinol oxidase subunit II n=1 Tax=Herbiconiux sp. L3-i23 TaxID=2905871 RepID=UPI0020481971|nr:cytochrome d ubiquinol oxidase subunit II [Herbiconiux sp. L3-i23]BDI23120.1 cytochrome c oxidase assembly protein [Herbiconiux sp. L3-i23]
MDVLPTIWFVAIALLWVGYLILEGFDLGVGMHLLFSSKSDRERRLMLNTIGPVWDGNQVWLITAGAATFAAFPLWYASLFSALYLPLVFVLLGLIFRAVAIEYRGKGSTDRWRRWWDRALGFGSLVAAFGVGAALAVSTLGLPLNENGDREGGAFAWLSWPAVLGGLAVVGFALVQGAAYLALKTDGDVRHRMRRFVTHRAPIALLPIVAWVLVVQFLYGDLLSWMLVVVAVVAVLLSWLFARAGREGRSFAAMSVFLGAGAGALFSAVYPVVLPSTLDPAWNLTISNASSGDYTLTVMTVVTAIGLPLVLAYQAWSIRVFSKRLSEDHIPSAHEIIPAVLRAGGGKSEDAAGVSGR